MDKVKRGGWRFRGLYWRVAVSYFLVTLLAALTIDAAVVVGPFLRDVQQIQRAPLPELLARNEAPRVASYLEQTHPEHQGLQQWLSGTLFHDISSTQPSFMAIVGQHGQALATVSCSSSKAVTSTTGRCVAADAMQAASVLAPALIQDTMFAALSGDPGPQETLSPDPKEQVFIAVPIQSNDGQVLGALVLFIQGPLEVTTAETVGISNVGRNFFIFLRNLRPAGFYFILLATALGTVTGVLISRGITRRLRRIAQTTAAWSMGNFQMRVRDPSRDEVGQLVQDLNRMAEQLQMLLATRQELAVVEERHRLARELHDSVKQHVFANALLIRSARKVFPRDPDKAQAYLAEAEALAGQAQQELIDSIRALRPAALADKGLVEVLEEYTADWSRRTGVAAEVRTQGARTAPLDIEEALFRVTQEALANVARHSNAGQVEVWLAWTTENLSLTIQDNGKGFDVRRAEGKGLGLVTMHERVEALYGTLAVASTAGRTRIEASVPLSPARADESVEAVDE